MSPRAHVLVELTCARLAALERGDDEARIGFALRPLRLGDDEALPAPAIERTPLEILEAARRAAGLLGRGFRRGKLLFDHGDEAVVAGEPEQVIHAVLLAPRHQRLARKATVGSQQDARKRPAGADLPDDPRNLLDATRTGVDVGAAQLGRQQVPATEHVQRQITVAVVIAVEEASLLMPVQCRWHPDRG
jgi:hypothetical protein